MQELRFVLIIVGALAIAALLFHGLWTSKKEGKAKFGNKPLGKLDVDNDDADIVPERAFAPEDDFEIIKKERKEPGFVAQDEIAADPLIDGYQEVDTTPAQSFTEPEPTQIKEDVELDVPSFSSRSIDEVDEIIEPVVVQEPEIKSTNLSDSELAKEEVVADAEEKTEEEPLEVIVLNVHCAGEEAFSGTELFDSMARHGLTYGAMSIFHCFTEPEGQGKVQFSVANMMQPGTLEHTDPAEFSTKGISFFMTLPGYGEPDQTFNLMLRTAQEIANDLGANVLDDARNLMTPNRLDSYRAQIQAFKAQKQA